MATGQKGYVGVHVRLAGERLRDLDLIVEHLSSQVHELVTVTRTDAVLAAIRMASDILKGHYVERTKTQRREYTKQRRRNSRAADPESTRGCADPFPPGTIQVPRSRGAQRDERE